MRARHVKNAQETIENCSFLIKEPTIKYFENNNPIILEIGMGKGQYLLNSALNNPNINYIGVEKFDSVIARAISKTSSYKLNNLLYIREDAKNLQNYFNNQISTIILNFSDPWPKKRHETRRLTNHFFLDIYNQLLINERKIIIKTDNLILFASSLKELNNYGAIFHEISFDLSNEGIPNILTEYEEKFIRQNIRINYLSCSLKRNDKR